MSANALYLGREWNTEHDHNQRVNVNNGELRYAVVGNGEPILCIHGTNIADRLITPLRFYPPFSTNIKSSATTAPATTVARRKEQPEHRGGRGARQATAGSPGHREGAHHGLLVWRGDRLQFFLSYPERAHSAILLEAYLPREAKEGVDANVKAYMRAMALYKAGDKLARGSGLYGRRVRAELSERGRNDGPARCVEAG